MDEAWVYHADGSVSDDAVAASPFGVVAILHRDTELGWVILHGRDWYWFARGQWWGGDLHGFLDQAMHLGATWPKQGRTVHDAEYEAVIARVATHRGELIAGG